MHNAIDDDEIAMAGFTTEPSRVVRSPRIAECLAHMECTLQWHRPLAEGNRARVFVGKVVHVAMDERACITDPRERLIALSTMYNVRSTLNPLTGETHPGGLGIVRLP